MILSDRDIREFLRKGKIGLENYNDLDDQIQPCSFDVHLGKEIRTYKAPYKSINDAANYSTQILESLDTIKDEVIIYPVWGGYFYLGTTQERIKIGHGICARIEGKSSLGRKGIHVHSTAGFIDAGFEGELTLEIYSVMPCIQILKPGQKIAQISFHLMTSDCERPYGKERGSNYQGQRGPTESVMK